MQGGDFTMQNGAGGESVYGKKFKDDPRGLAKTRARGRSPWGTRERIRTPHSFISR